MVVTRSRVLSGMAALIAASLVLFLWPREEPGVKEAVTRRIIGMTRFAEEKDVGEVKIGRASCRERVL